MPLSTPPIRRCWGGGGVDGAIPSAPAGPELFGRMPHASMAARRAMPRSTKGYQLRAKACDPMQVGPVLWHGGQQKRRMRWLCVLLSAVRSNCVRRHDIRPRSPFPPFSTGVYRFPADPGPPISRSRPASMRSLPRRASTRVVFCCFFFPTTSRPALHQPGT